QASDGIAGSNVANVVIRVNPVQQATTGKVTGSGSVDGGVRRFNVSVQSRDGNAGLAFVGQLDYEDRQKGIRLQSESITFLRVESDGVRATIRGTATVNGVRGYTFTVTVEDRGEPGVRTDRFRIQITGPGGFSYDSLDFATLAGLLDSGNIQVHKQKS